MDSDALTSGKIARLDDPEIIFSIQMSLRKFLGKFVNSLLYISDGVVRIHLISIFSLQISKPFRPERFFNKESFLGHLYDLPLGIADKRPYEFALQSFLGDI